MHAVDSIKTCSPAPSRLGSPCWFSRAVCAFARRAAGGEAAQRWQVTHAAAQLRKWPKEQLEAWGGWFMLSLFGAILVWEEAWDLPHSGVLSAALMLLITSGAVVTSLNYEKRMWCRHLCPIGAMNGLMAKVRARAHSVWGLCWVL